MPNEGQNKKTPYASFRITLQLLKLQIRHSLKIVPTYDIGKIILSTVPILHLELLDLKPGHSF